MSVYACVVNWYKVTILQDEFLSYQNERKRQKEEKETKPSRTLWDEALSLFWCLVDCTCHSGERKMKKDGSY